MIGARRKPFSTKKKKEQLKLKREKTRAQGDKWADSDDESATHPSNARRRLNEQPVREGAQSNLNRYRLHFQRESRDEIDRRKKLAQLPIVRMPEESLEIPIENIYRPGSALDMPVRPAWTYDMTKEQLEQQERTYFEGYLEKIFADFEGENLSFFEMNVETWRQLWRTVEICDIVLMIVDIRFAVSDARSVDPLEKDCVLAVGAALLAHALRLRHTCASEAADCHSEQDRSGSAGTGDRRPGLLCRQVSSVAHSHVHVVSERSGDAVRRLRELPSDGTHHQTQELLRHRPVGTVRVRGIDCWSEYRSVVVEAAHSGLHE